MRPQDLLAEAVDGADAGGVELGGDGVPTLPLIGLQIGPGEVVPHLLADAPAHLAGGLAGEGDGDNAAQGQAAGQQSEKAGGEGPGLARARARGHQRVRGAEGRVRLGVAEGEGVEDGMVGGGHGGRARCSAHDFAALCYHKRTGPAMASLSRLLPFQLQQRD